ncbi:MAG: NADH-quinone oxidoreductase subunit M [Pseudomonadota bacterium]
MDYLIYNTLNFPIISLVLALPLLGALVTLAVPDSRGKKASFHKIWGVIVSVVTAVAALPLYNRFDTSTHLYQFVEKRAWIDALNLNYTVGIDGISLLLVMLTVFIMPVALLCSFTYIGERHKEFVFSILLMETVMVGVFVSLNLVLFFIFWEAMLVPMYLLIAVWGGERKDYASIKFFLYTLLGSVFLIVSMISIYIKTGTFFIPAIMDVQFDPGFQILVFLAFALAFAIKIPMFPLHTWLPAAHVEAPASGSVILAAVLLKMGGYGFLRFCIPMTPAAFQLFAPAFIVLSVVSIIAGGYLALGQTDMKKLIAYSSVGHMGFVTLGIFVISAMGLKGAVLQMINHGITTGALFVCVGLLYERTHSREIADNSALGRAMPVFLTFFVIFALSSFGFPGTNSFVGEIMILIAAFKQSTLLGFAVIPGAILAAAYMLRLTQKMIWADDDGHDHGKPSKKGWDLNIREMATLLFLAVFVFWIGLFPKPFLAIMDVSVAHLLDQYHHGIEHMVEPHTTGHAVLFSLKALFSGLI